MTTVLVHLYASFDYAPGVYLFINDKQEVKPLSKFTKTDHTQGLLDLGAKVAAPRISQLGLARANISYLEPCF